MAFPILGIIGGKSTIKWALIGIVAFTIGTAMFLGYRHYTNLLETVSVLERNNVKLTQAVETQDRTISAQQSAITEWQQSQDALVNRVSEMQEVYRKASAETNKLRDLFNDHDLTKLSRRKPGLMERRFNSGSRDAYCLLTKASGGTCSEDNGNSGRSTDKPSEPSEP